MSPRKAARVREQTKPAQLDSTNACKALRKTCGNQSRLLVDNSATLLQDHTGYLNDLGLCNAARIGGNGTSRIKRPRKEGAGTGFIAGEVRRIMAAVSGRGREGEA